MVIVAAAFANVVANNPLINKKTATKRFTKTSA